MLWIRKFGCLRTTASCIAPHAPKRIRSCCSGTCLHWSCGVIHGACTSTSLNVTLCVYRAPVIPVLACIHCVTTCCPRLIQPNILASTCPPSSAGPPHVSSVVSKTNSTLGFLRRNLRKCSSKLKVTAYLSLVRSTLEYVATIWDPHYIRDIDSSEQVQRGAARFTTGDYHTTSSVTAMLAELEWKWLEDRRKDLRLALLYKIVHGQVAVPVDALDLELPVPRTRKKHKYMYKHLTPHTDPYKHFFLCRTIPGWNCLPAGVVEATSVESFKTHLAGRPQRDQPWSGTPTPSVVHSRGGLQINLPDQTRPDGMTLPQYQPHSTVQAVCYVALLR